MKIVLNYKKKIEFGQYRRSDKVPGIIYEDLEFLDKKVDERKNNPKKHSTIVANEYILPGPPISTIWTFDGIETKHEVYISEDCIKMFCRSIKEHPIKIISLDKKKRIPLTNKEQESYASQEICHVCYQML